MNEWDELDIIVQRALNWIGLAAAVVLIFGTIYITGCAADAFLTPDHLRGIIR